MSQIETQVSSIIKGLKTIEELKRVFCSELRDIEAVKKMIRLLVAYSKEEIPLTTEHEDFVEL